MTDLQGRVILLTGASRGLGRVLAEILLTYNIKKMYVTARNITTLEIFHDNRVVPIQLEITDSRQIHQLAEQAQDIDMLINNVGVNLYGSILTTPLEKIEQEMAVNYFGTLNMIRAFYPIIEANGGGNIINMNSICSYAGMPGLAGYCASKAALFSITQSMRPELAKRNIRVHGVFPGPIDTDMNAGKDVPDMAEPHDTAQAIINGILNDEDDIYPDPIGKQVGQDWRTNAKMLIEEMNVVLEH